MKKQLGIAAASLVGLAAGAGAGFALTGGSGGASAQETPTTTADAPTTTTAPKDSRLEEILAPLVANGTITQSQADAVIKALEAARPGPGHSGHPGQFHRGFGLDTAATAIGISADDLLTALRSGQTIAEVAKAHGVDPSKVIDAMVAEVTARENAEVTSGSQTQAQADAKVAAAKDRITAIVNGKVPPFGDRDHDRAPAPSTTTA